MKLSIYLLRDTVKDFDGVLQTKYLESSGFKELKTKGALPYSCKAYIQVNKSAPPKWAGFLGAHFDVRGVANQTNSFVLLIKAQRRIFAVTFGLGFHALNPAFIEPRFGLFVAANWLTEIKGIEANMIDRVSANKKLHQGKGSNISEFSFNPQVDFIRRLSGTLPKNKTASTVTGCDSCCIGVSCDITKLDSVCKELFKKYKSTEYKKNFAFLDHLVPLNKHDPQLGELHKLLVERLESQSYEQISISFPEMPNEELLQHYQVVSGSKAIMEELTLEGIYSFIADNNLSSDPDSIHVVGIGDADQAITRRRRLSDYLAAEIVKDDDTFLFCNGNWFKAETDYVKSVRDQVSAIEDLTSALSMVPIGNDDSEGEYNERIAGFNEWVSMDKKNFVIGGSRDKIEVCDLLTKSRELICVKKMESSSTLSHLFSQGSVSATLLRRDPKYRANLNRFGKKQWHDFEEVDEASLSAVKIVYAVATRKSESLAEGMFFFSLVNLLSHVETIRLTGCKVALAKIDYEADPKANKKVKRKRNKRKPATA